MSAAVHVIHPTGLYDLSTARELLGVPKGCLPREIRLGRLRVSKRAKKYYFLGEWLLEWLRAGEVVRGKRPRADAARNGELAISQGS